MSKEKYKTYQQLPKLHTSVIVYDETKYEKFSAYLTTVDTELCWCGTCGIYKDKYIPINYQSQEWSYER